MTNHRLIEQNDGRLSDSDAGRQLIGDTREPDDFSELLNLEKRVLGAMCIDLSGSMNRHREEVVAAFREMSRAISQDVLTRLRVELSFCRFSDRVFTDSFRPAPAYVNDPLGLPDPGRTSLGAAICGTVKRISKRREVLAAQGIEVLESVALFVSDGGATDDLFKAMDLIQISKPAIQFIPVVAHERDWETMRRIFDEDPILLERLDFSKLFNAVSHSVSRYAQSSAGYEPRVSQLLLEELSDDEE